MKVLLLNPSHLRGIRYMKELGRCGRKNVAGETWPQTGLAYLAAMVEKDGHKARIIDAMTVGMTIEELEREVTGFAPDLIVAEVSTPTFRNDAKVMRRLKALRPDAVTSMAGTHVSALPEESLRESGVDLLLINEAEATISELCALLSEYPDISRHKDALGKIAGLAFMNDEECVITPDRGYVKDLNALPFPARHLLPNESYKMPFFEDKPFVTLIPTRGCPWKCTFCRAGSVWGRAVRTRCPENVIEEIRQVKSDFAITSIVFMTDSLTLNKRWAKEFFEALAEAHLGVEWICNSRVDAVDVEMLDLMKRAGCTLISYGIESGSQAILDAVKKEISLEQAAEAIRLTRKAGITAMAYFIIGLPGETWDTIEQTLQFAEQIDTDYVNFHIATPFPGTEFYETAKKNGWLTSENWEDYEEEGSAVVRTEALSTDDLKRAQKMAMRKFYLRPSRLMREILRTKSTKEFMAKLNAGKSILRTLFKKNR